MKAWERLGTLAAYGVEHAGFLSNPPSDDRVAGYFGNSLVLRSDEGEILHLVYYRPDHTMSSWCDGEWAEGKWLVNTGQDALTIAHTREDLFDTPVHWGHCFAPYKKVGDRWISPETWGGHPTYLASTGIPVELVEGMARVIGIAEILPGIYFSLEKGLVKPGKKLGKHGPYAKEFEALPSNPKDKHAEGYFGNSLVMRKPDGTILHVIYYAADHTNPSWRDGRWTLPEVCKGWFINNAQDGSILFQTRCDIFPEPATWCHSFAPNKKVGDRWISPERFGHPVYPLSVGGVPVVMVDGKQVVAGVPGAEPYEVFGIEAGLVSPD